MKYRTLIASALAWLVFGLVVAFGPIGQFISNGSRMSEERSKDRPTQTQVEKRFEVVLDRALAMKPYTADQQQKDFKELAEIRASAWSTAPFSVDALSKFAEARYDITKDRIEQLGETSFDQFERTAAYHRRISGEPEQGIDWRPVGKAVVTGSLWLAFWYLLLVITTIACLVMKTLISVPVLRQGCATVWEEFQIICVSSIMLWTGIENYKPGESFPERIAETAGRLAEIKLRAKVPTYKFDYNPNLQLKLKLEKLSFLPALLATWKAIWGPDLRWTTAIIQIWRAPVRTAIYLSVLAPFILLTADGMTCQAAYADEAADKEGPHFVGQLFTSTYPFNPGPNGPPGHHAFWLFKEGDIVVFNVQDPGSSVLEVAPRLLSYKIGQAGGTVGPFMNLSLGSDVTQTQPITRFGIETVGRWQIDEKTQLQGPIYVYLTGQGHRFGVFSPNLRLLHQVGKRVKVGLATTIGYERGLGLSNLFGPAVELKIGNRATLLLRGGQWLAGPLKGTHQLRSDLVWTF